ncbi:MAG TPA: hypothetical protein VGD66_04325 [Allosphingosinicella sp.]|jgi:hypothetical protein
MKGAAFTAALGLLGLSACAHPEDRRWLRTEIPAELPTDELPQVQVYSVATAAPPGKIRLTELSDRGQAALIEALAKTNADAATLRSLVAAPLASGGDGSGLVDRTQLDRTLIISVSKGVAAEPGDRLMRTIVTITPHRDAGQRRPPFEFAGYTIAATDNKTQNIAHLETKSDASLTATISPTIKGTGDNSLVGALSRSHTTTADIAQQYENLNIDITPERLIVTRESERGLDVVGNTIIALTLATPPRTSQPTAFLASDVKFHDKGKALPPKTASFTLRPLQYLPACPLRADVRLRYQLRHIVTGREYYTEGKQTASIVSDTIELPNQILVRPEDAQGQLYQIKIYRHRVEDGAIIATTVDGGQQPLLFDDYAEASRVAAWMKGRRDTVIGPDRVRLGKGDEHISAGSTFQAESYRLDCPPPTS